MDTRTGDDSALVTPEMRARVGPHLDALRSYGYVILPEVLSADQVAQLAAEIERLHDTVTTGRSQPEGYRTLRIYNLLAKTRLGDPVVLHPTVLALADAVLGEHFQLSIASTATVLPGEVRQGFHRDDLFYDIPYPHRPLVLNTMWAISAFTEENGATVLVPGSHTWPGEPPADARVVAAEMPPGSVLLWDGAIWHSAGANRSDAPRVGLNFNYNCAWLRQQENQYLAVPRETVRQLPRPLQRLLGYWMVPPALGIVDGRSPLRALKEG